MLKCWIIIMLNYVELFRLCWVWFETPRPRGWVVMIMKVEQNRACSIAVQWNPRAWQAIEPRAWQAIEPWAWQAIEPPSLAGNWTPSLADNWTPSLAGNWTPSLAGNWTPSLAGNWTLSLAGNWRTDLDLLHSFEILDRFVLGFHHIPQVLDIGKVRFDGVRSQNNWSDWLWWHHNIKKLEKYIFLCIYLYIYYEYNWDRLQFNKTTTTEPSHMKFFIFKNGSLPVFQLFRRNRIPRFPWQTIYVLWFD